MHYVVHICDFGMLRVKICSFLLISKAVGRSNIMAIKSTVEPRYKQGPWDHENYLVISGFSLYQGTKTKKYKELGPAKLPCYKRVLLYPTYL